MISEVKIKLLKAFPKILSASLGFFSPNLIEASGAPPRPKRLLKAVMIVIIDVHKPIPAMDKQMKTKWEQHTT